VMSFIPKNWQDVPATATPINSAALKDLETRVTNYAEEVPISSTQLPASVVRDSRGSAVGDLLLFNGSSFVRFPRGGVGEEMVVGLDGTVRYQPAAVLNLDAIISEGVTPTEALEKANEHFAAKAGGTLIIGGGSVTEYTFKKMVLATGVRWLAPAGPHATVIKQETGVNEPLVQSAVGPVQGTVVDGLSFVPNEQGYALLLEALEDPVKKTGGLYECVFQNCLFGRSSSPAEMASVWLRGSPSNSSLIHQFIYFRNCTFYRANTGTKANISRCVKITGRCEKIFFDEQCIYNGSKAQEKVGTNIEVGREFSSPTALTAEAAAGASVYHVTSATGIVAGSIVRVGEGAGADTRKVKEVNGTEIVLTTAMTFAHAAGENSYLLAGSSAASFIGLLGTSQNCSLNVYLDNSLTVNVGGQTPMDMEYGTCGVRAVEGCWRLSVNLRPLNVSEGISNGNGEVTAGSSTITGATGTWAKGNTLSIPGFSAEVTEVSGTTLTLGAPVPANGATGAQTIPLVKGGKGEGYLLSLENGSLADYSWDVQGAIDRTAIADATSSATSFGLTRGTALPTRTTSGLTPVLTAVGGLLKVGKSREVVLGSGAEITTVSSLHGTGEELTLRAPSTTKIGSSGNITIPSGGSIVLAAGDAITIRKQDHTGTQAWVLAGVVRAQEELEWKAVEEVNAKLEAAGAGYAPFEYAVLHGLVYLRGVMTVKAGEAVKTTEALCKIPTAGHPTYKQLLVTGSTVASTGTTITVTTGGLVECQEELVATKKISLSAPPYPLN
jgi:hypothetical protein